MMTRCRHLFGILAFAVASVATAGARAQLIPRTPLPKAAAISKPAYETRLTVKFRDHLKARAREASVIVELIPDQAGPYQGDQSVTVDVWLHSQVSFDARLWVVQLDFSDSDGQLVLDPTFTFDLSSSWYPEHFEVHSELPIPWAANTLAYFCPQCRLQLPAGGSLHIGSIGVNLLNEEGTYRLDVLNADDPDETRGARIIGEGFYWRAFTGEITGGAYSFAVIVPPIPTVSQWGIMAMGLLLLVLGSLMILRRTQSATDATCFAAEGTGTRLVCNEALRSRAPLFALICAGGVLLGSSSDATAEAPSRPVETIQVSIDSGVVFPTGTGNDPVVVFSRFVQVKGAAWVRLRFGEVQLSGSSANGDESFIRVTSLCDDVQVLDSSALGIWGGTSAYFNGDRVLVELVAHANTGPNRLTIDRIAAGPLSASEAIFSICGTDDRVPSSDPRVARFRFFGPLGQCLYDNWCTAFLFDDRPNCAITAGHCCLGVDWTCASTSCDGGFPAIVEFNVPPSEPGGSINCSHPNDQYPVEQIFPDQWQWFGTGDDWCYFGLFNNPNTGLTPLEAQGASYQLAQTVPNDNYGSTLRVTGHGIGPPEGGPYDERNGTQQTDSGPYYAKDGNTVEFVVDISSGNSGSAVEHVADGLVYAIVTGVGCTATGGANKGTAIDHPALQDALACATGVCAVDCNSNGIIDQCDIDCLSCGEDCNVPGCGESNDCQPNGIPDDCDISSGTSEDCQPNGIPDECELDCQPNGIPDDCDISSGTSGDCDGDGIPNECESEGACCLVIRCLNLTELDCHHLSGLYQGNGSCCQVPWACPYTGPQQP